MQPHHQPVVPASKRWKPTVVFLVLENIKEIKFLEDHVKQKPIPLRCFFLSMEKRGFVFK